MPYSGVVQGIARVVDTDPEGSEGLLWRMRDDVRSIQCPLLDLIDKIHREIMVQGDSGTTGLSMLITLTKQRTSSYRALSTSAPEKAKFHNWCGAQSEGFPSKQPVRYSVCSGS